MFPKASLHIIKGNPNWISLFSKGISSQTQCLWDNLFHFKLQFLRKLRSLWITWDVWNKVSHRISCHQNSQTNFPHFLFFKVQFRLTDPVVVLVVIVSTLLPMFKRVNRIFLKFLLKFSLSQVPSSSVFFIRVWGVLKLLLFKWLVEFSSGVTWFWAFFCCWEILITDWISLLVIGLFKFSILSPVLIDCMFLGIFPYLLGYPICCCTGHNMLL